jgi:hypothetical protein
MPSEVETQHTTACGGKTTGISTFGFEGAKFEVASRLLDRDCL